MMNPLFVLLGLLHLGALVSLIIFYCRWQKMPWREWPLAVMLLLWGAMVVAGYLLSPLNMLDSLPAYVIATFAGLALVLLAHRATIVAPQYKAPYAPLKLPVFAEIKWPQLRRYLWWGLLGTLGIAFLVHLVVCFAFYPVNADSLNYRLARPVWYVSHGNLLHPFVAEDKRLTFYPLNGILLYVPFVLYNVSSVFWSLPSLYAWIIVAYTAYRFARALGADRLIATAAVWLVAMTPSILIEASSTNDEILTAVTLLAGMFFFWRWLTSSAGHYLFLAALGLGLCIGTKLHIFFLVPIFLLGLAWFAAFLWRRHESWWKYVPRVRLSALLLSLVALGVAGPLFLIMNKISSGDFYFLGETADKVLNIGGSLQDAAQNFIIYLSEMILAPIADLDFWQNFYDHEMTNRALNGFFTPLIAPFVSLDPHFYHLEYRFHGVVIPTSVLLVEYGLWPGFVWLLWPLQAFGLLRQKFTLRPLFAILAATPLLWFAIWSCVTLYMEGVPTYFAFYLICAAPAMGLCFLRLPSPRGSKARWITLAFVALTTLVIDGNVMVNNVFRGLTNLVEDAPWPYDWLQFEQPTIDEIKRADKIQIALTHGKVYYFSFMHWNPRAHYYSPYEAAPDPEHVLHIISTPSEYAYGFIPIWIPDKPTSGITLLGKIRGVDEEYIFAFGNGVAARHPESSRYVSLHLSAQRSDEGKYTITVDKAAAGLNPEDRLEFKYALRGPDGKVVFERPWSSDPGFETEVPDDPRQGRYALNVAVRSALNYDQSGSFDYPVGSVGAWTLSPPRP